MVLVNSPDKVSGRISDGGARGTVVGGGRSERCGAAADGDVGGGRDGEVDPANSVASDYGDFLRVQSPTSSHCSRRSLLPVETKTLAKHWN